MSANVWQVISWTGFSLAVVFAVIAAILFFKLHIRSVISDLSGKRVAREIKEIQDRTAQEDKKGHLDHFVLEKSSKRTPVVTEMNTDDIKRAHASKRLDQITDRQDRFDDQERMMKTEKISSKYEAIDTADLEGVNHAGNVANADAGQYETEDTVPLSAAQAKTETLTDADPATMPLDESGHRDEDADKKTFEVVETKISVHSNEVIK